MWAGHLVMCLGELEALGLITDSLLLKLSVLLATNLQTIALDVLKNSNNKANKLNNCYCER